MFARRLTISKVAGIENAILLMLIYLQATTVALSYFLHVHGNSRIFCFVHSYGAKWWMKTHAQN